jgi:hypothetical protein
MQISRTLYSKHEKIAMTEPSATLEPSKQRGISSSSYVSMVFFATFSLIPAALQAQNILADPSFGSVTLTAGFAPDPQIKTISAGGSTSFASCGGYFAADPDFNLNYTSGEYDLSIFAKSAVDTTLAVNAPDGSWLCSDDSSSLGNSNPGLLIDNPGTGLYNIWVGVYSESDAYETSTLVITEQAESNWNSLDLSGGDVVGSDLDFSATPSFGTVPLQSGFTPDPNTTEILAGGSIESGRCTGFYASAPDLNLDYVAAEYTLGFVSRSTGDTTLVVNDADGNWHCNDDSEFAGGNNAAIYLENPPSGQYNIWVGTFSSDQALELQTNLMITETATSNWLTLGQGQGVVDDTAVSNDVVTNEVVNSGAVNSNTESSEIIDQSAAEEIVPTQSAVQFGRKNN